MINQTLLRIIFYTRKLSVSNRQIVFSELIIKLLLIKQ